MCTPGAVLASPLNSEVWSVLQKILSDSEPRVGLVYSGVHATFSDGVYSSVEGLYFLPTPVISDSLKYLEQKAQFENFYEY